VFLSLAFPILQNIFPFTRQNMLVSVVFVAAPRAFLPASGWMRLEDYSSIAISKVAWIHFSTAYGFPVRA